MTGNMKDRLIEFKTAKLAKEKGFDLECNYAYEKQGYTFQTFDIREKKNSSFLATSKNHPNNIYWSFFCSAPTQSLLQKWIREKHDKTVLIGVLNGTYLYKIYTSDIKHCKVCTGNYNTYEEALETGLYETLKLIK